MKKTITASLIVITMALPQLSAGSIIVAGWHEYTSNPSKTKTANSPANEGVPGIYNSPNTNLSHRQTTTGPGGSIDGWYGPDSVALGGARTEQVLAIPASIPGYVLETTNPGSPRFVSPFVDVADYSGLPPNTNFDGRLTNMNGTDLTISNNSLTTLTLQSLVFDAFLGDSSANTGSAQLDLFTYTVTINGNAVTSTLLPSFGVAGLNSTAGYGPLNTIFPGPTNVIPNAVDFGTGTNYVDYSITLDGVQFAPGDRFTIGFSSVGIGTIHLDNIALLAVPEPSIIGLLGLVGSACFFRRRKKASI